MPLDRTDTIDLVSLNASGDEVTAYVVTAASWDEHGDMALQLQKKLKSYVSFMADGMLEETYPEARGKKKRIEVRSKFPLGEVEQQLVTAVHEHWCGAEGIDLLVEIRPELEGSA